MLRHPALQEILCHLWKPEPLTEFTEDGATGPYHIPTQKNPLQIPTLFFPGENKFCPTGCDNGRSIQRYDGL